MYIHVACECLLIVYSKVKLDGKILLNFISSRDGPVKGTETARTEMETCSVVG